MSKMAELESEQEGQGKVEKWGACPSNEKAEKAHRWRLKRQEQERLEYEEAPVCLATTDSVIQIPVLVS